MIKRPLPRYFAKLLFQFRVGERDYAKFRTCEERIVALDRKSAGPALKEAKRLGTKSQFRYVNDQGIDVYFEFVGVLDLLEIGIEGGANEVWYDIKTMLRPMERRDLLVPSDARLIDLSRGANVVPTEKAADRVRRR